MIYTFYSFKGGVGRSMALANVAESFSVEGLRVVIVDWDLEAPGIENFFFSSGAEVELVQSQLGLLDMLLAYQKRLPGFLSSQRANHAAETSGESSFSDQLEEWLPPVSTWLYPIRSGEAGQLALLTAGWRNGNRFASYAEAVRRFDWADFYVSYRGEDYFNWLRRQLESVADVVLIDSPTGVSHVARICAHKLRMLSSFFVLPICKT